MRTLVGSVSALLVLAGCAGTGGVVYAPEETVVQLDVSFVDDAWDGRTVPKVGMCRDGKGGGMSPAIRVGGIPVEAEAVVVEFNDTGYHDLAEYGGHGAIWVATNGAAEVVVPSVPECSMALPAGVHMEHGHRAAWFGPGAYLAPCSLGAGHLYVARVMAVQKSGPGAPRFLGEASLSLGVY